LIAVLPALPAAAWPAAPRPVPAQDGEKREGQDDPPLPSKEQIDEAVLDLKKAFDSKETADRIAAIERRSDVLSSQVVEWIAKGLKDQERDVRMAAIQALRWMEHPAALEALHDLYGRDKKLRKDEELHEALLKAIAQHGSVTSIAILSETSSKDATHKIVQARILGLGRIRNPQAVEALFQLMKSQGRHRVQPYMDHFRLSLLVLLGDDHGGKSQDAWLRWWNEHRKELVVAPQPPELPDLLQRAWSRYWDLEVEYERPERRRERGGD
jgi:hypothetical protein